MRQWHSLALPIIGTKDFDSTWGDFVPSWPRARLPLMDDLLTQAWERSLASPEPAAASQYDSEPVRRLVGLCAELARLSPAGRFFLAAGGAGRLLGLQSMVCYRWLLMLQADGILMLEEPGNKRRATRYRWLPPSQNTQPKAME